MIIEDQRTTPGLSHLKVVFRKGPNTMDLIVLLRRKVSYSTAICSKLDRPTLSSVLSIAVQNFVFTKYDLTLVSQVFGERGGGRDLCFTGTYLSCDCFLKRGTRPAALTSTMTCRCVHSDPSRSYIVKFCSMIRVPIVGM